MFAAAGPLPVRFHVLPAFSLLQDRHERTRADGWSWQDDGAEWRDIWDIHGYWYGNPLLACSRGSRRSSSVGDQISRYLEARAPHRTVKHHPPSSADCKHAFYQISTLLPSLTPAAMRINKPLYDIKVLCHSLNPAQVFLPLALLVWERGATAFPSPAKVPLWLMWINCQVPLATTGGSELAPFLCSRQQEQMASQGAKDTRRTRATPVPEGKLQLLPFRQPQQPQAEPCCQGWARKTAPIPPGPTGVLGEDRRVASPQALSSPSASPSYPCPAGAVGHSFEGRSHAPSAVPPVRACPGLFPALAREGAVLQEQPLPRACPSGSARCHGLPGRGAWLRPFTGLQHCRQLGALLQHRHLRYLPFWQGFSPLLYPG